MADLSNTHAFGKWIPCSERLPTETPGFFKWQKSYSELVLITVQKNGKAHVESGIRTNGKWLGCDEHEVIAWMPLPEPYNPNGAKMEEEV